MDTSNLKIYHSYTSSFPTRIKAFLFPLPQGRLVWPILGSLGFPPSKGWWLCYSFHRLLLKVPVTEQLTGRAVVQGRMQALAVVENLNVLEGHGPHSIARLESRRIY